MKPCLALFACLPLAGLSVGACSRVPESAQEAAARDVAPAGAASVASPSPASSPAAPRRETVDNDLMDFDYAYPPQAAAIPALAALLEADIARQKRELLPQARAMQKEAKENGYPFHGLGYWVEWQVVTDLPGWLSLSTQVGTFMGGAHPNYHYDTILWDRQAGKRRAPVSLFVSPGALDKAIRRDFCRELDLQRKEKRQGEGAPESVIPEFDGCIAPLENTLILGSSNGKAFDRLGILIAPYDAGPYAEGSYEVTLPVTAAVLAAVRPEYRPTFVVKR